MRTLLPHLCSMVDALIKANKDFDFLILPNGIHADGFHPYITRKRWDYFVKHLLGATPPAGYAIKRVELAGTGCTVLNLDAVTGT